MLSLTRPVWLILIGASLMLTLAMGLRQSLGIFMPSLTADIGISVSDFTLAIAVQNLVWGFMQPVVGALVVRTGFRGPMLFGALRVRLQHLAKRQVSHSGPFSRLPRVPAAAHPHRWCGAP